MPITSRIDPGATPGTFKVVVDGNPPAMMWIKWYSTTESSISEPELKETPYDDTGGNLAVDVLRSPTFPYSTSDITMPANTRWVLAIVWVMDPANATLIRSISTREFTTTTTTSSSTSSTSSTSSSTTQSSTTGSSTTGSSTTGSSTTGSSTTGSSTTSGSSGMATWTWQNMGGVNQWVLTTACSSGTASPPGFNGMMPGDSAQTSCS